MSRLPGVLRIAHRWSLAGLLILCMARSASAAVVIDFNHFPGSDNQLGTSDDVSINAGSGNGQAVFFTNEFAHLAGGIGVVVDSAVGGNPSLGYNNNLGAVASFSGNNVLVTARPDAGSGQYGFGAVRYRFVSSADGVTPATAGQVSFDFVPGVADSFTDTAKFYNASGTLLATINYVDGTDNPHISYANSAGIARVDISTQFSVATDNFSFAVPEPTTLSLLALAGMVMFRRNRRAYGRE